MCARDSSADQNADLLDQAYLGDLERHLGVPATAGLLTQGIEDLAARLDQLSGPASPAGEAALARAAHDIVGGAGQLGLAALTQLARELHSAADAGRGDESRRLLARMADNAPRSFDALRRWISSRR
ncbi:MAG: Hpt domain-containing protein [Pseudomonadota bacterium]